MSSTEHITLATPIRLQTGITVKNRLFKSAMSEQLGDKHHNPTPDITRLYDIWAHGGIGVSVTGNVMVDRSALGEPRNIVLDEHSDLPCFERWAKAGTKNNTLLWMQLNHPGKQTPKFLTRTPVAPSAIPLGAGLGNAFNTPRALTEPEIIEVIKKFAHSAALAKSAGFSGVQIHGAHGYLVSQFLSPHHNTRTDDWGGTLDNRMRFVLETYRHIRQAVGQDFPVSIKLNSADFMKSGFTPEDSIQVAQALEKEGIDLIEISGGTYEAPSMTGYKVRSSTREREAYFLSFAEQLDQKIDIPLVVTGGFRSGPAMRAALMSGATDMIGLARPLAVDPGFPDKLLADPQFSLHLKDPSTGFKTVDKMTMLSITWYEYQLERLSKNKRVDPNLNAWYAVFQTVARMGIHAFLKRRA